MFVKHEDSTRTKKTFSTFKDSWEKHDVPQSAIQKVIVKVQDVITPENILLLVDEPSKTRVPSQVREVLFSEWFHDHPQDRMVLTSLDPSHLLTPADSDYGVIWIQYLRDGEGVVKRVFTSIP